MLGYGTHHAASTNVLVAAEGASCSHRALAKEALMPVHARASFTEIKRRPRNTKSNKKNRACKAIKEGDKRSQVKETKEATRQSVLSDDLDCDFNCD